MRLFYTFEPARPTTLDLALRFNIATLDPLDSNIYVQPNRRIA